MVEMTTTQKLWTVVKNRKQNLSHWWIKNTNGCRYLL